MKRYFLLFLVMAVSLITALAQNENDKANIVEVTGTVTDVKNEPLVGVTVSVRDKVGYNAITDVNGHYKLKAPQYSNLIFSYIGMESKTILLKNQKVINVKMEELKENVVDEVVITGTGVQKKITLSGAVTTVNPEDLRTPTASLSNAFAGVVPGVFARQVTGQPGNNVSEFWIRGVSTFGAGSSALVLVDGFERNLDDIAPEDIESFTVLKDASATAIYGSRGANGVLLINTKRGRIGKTHVNVKGEYSWSTRTQTPEFVDGLTYAKLKNEAFATRSQQVPYSASDLYLLEHQLDPELFPNVNWTKLLLRKGAPSYRGFADFSGGGDVARYFVSVSYVNEGGMYKVDKAMKDYDTNANYHRFNYRMNVDMNLTKTTLLKVGVSGSLEKQNEPGMPNDEIWYSIMGTNPITTPIRYKNGRWGAYGTGKETNPYVMITQTGYNETWKNTVQTTANLEQDLRFITKGLKFYGRFGFDVYSNNGNRRKKWPEQWKTERLRSATGDLLWTKVIDQSLLQSNPWSNTTRKEFIELQMDYDRTFGGHQVGGVLKYSQDQTTDSWINYRHQGLAGRFTYGYKYRYYVDFNFGYNGSENFAKGHRFGFFPAVSGAWNLGEEPFVKKNLPWVNMFKIRYSYGRVGNDNLGSNRFPFRATYGIYDADDYMYGDIDQSLFYYKGLSWTKLATENVTWEVAKKHDLGVDMYLFGNDFSATIDYFNEKRTGIYMARSYIAPSIGLNGKVPSANVGAVRSYGMDGNFSVHHKFAQVDVTLRGNFTLSRNKVLDYDEAYSHYSYSRNSGFRVGQARGLIALGLFKDYDDIRHSPDQSALGPKEDIAPGDIKYKDVNGDGKIDGNDIVPIGATVKPNFIYGFGTSVRWKGFDVNVLFQGVGKSSFFINGFTVYPFQSGAWGNILKDVVGNYWSLGTNEDPTAKYPRLSYGGNGNNYRASSYWLRDGRYLRLKNLEVGYTLPKRWTTVMHISSARFYFMGTNLLTFAPFKLWDPELGSSTGQQYPLSRTITFGLTVGI